MAGGLVWLVYALWSVICVGCTLFTAKGSMIVGLNNNMTCMLNLMSKARKGKICAEFVYLGQKKYLNYA